VKSFLYLAIISIVTIPTAVFAQNYLVGIPGVDQGGGDFDAYIQAVYVMFISIAALLAVVKIIIAGLKYMFTDIVTQKGDAKKDIQGAVFGLLVVLSAVLILTVINPELTGFNFEQERVAVPEPVNTVNTVGTLLDNEIPVCPDNETYTIVDTYGSCQNSGDVEDAITITSLDENVDFLFTVINNQSYLDSRERSSELRDLELSEIVGAVLVPGTIEGSMTDMDFVEYEILRPRCENVAGENSRIIKVRRAQINGFIYYCINPAN
jgi:hypothetical protein